MNTLFSTALALLALPLSAQAYESISTCNFASVPARSQGLTGGTYVLAGSELQPDSAKARFLELKKIPSIDDQNTTDSFGQFYFEEVSKVTVVASQPATDARGYDMGEDIALKDVCLRSASESYKCQTLCTYTKYYIDNR